MTPYLVYALYTRHDGAKQYFYVGKTRRGIATRLREHARRASHGHEDVYAHLRRLDAAGIPWDCELIRTCAGSDYAPDAERWEVIRILRLGHDLRNMRYGDARHRAELVRQQHDPLIRSAADVTRDRLATHHGGALRRGIRGHGRLRRRELARLLKQQGIASVRACPLLGPVLARRLARQGDLEVDRGITVQELVRYARDARRWDSLARFGASLPPPRA